MLWAVLFDWYDGTVARRIPGRSDILKSIGARMDSLVDIVSLAVCPAVILLSYGDFEPIFLVGAFIMLAASAIRLSYFSTFGLSGGSHYTGLALDNNSIILVFIFMFEGIPDQGNFSIVLYASCLLLAALNVSQIKTPKLSGKPVNVRILGIYTLAVTGVYGLKFF